MRKYSDKTWEYFSAYGHGYAYGRIGLELDNLWQLGETGFLYEKEGWEQGLNDYELFGTLKGELYNESHY